MNGFERALPAFGLSDAARQLLTDWGPYTQSFDRVVPVLQPDRLQAPPPPGTRCSLHLPPCTNESRHTHATPHTRHGTRGREFPPPGPASDLAGRGRATPNRHVPGDRRSVVAG